MMCTFNLSLVNIVLVNFVACTCAPRSASTKCYALRATTVADVTPIAATDFEYIVKCKW